MIVYTKQELVLHPPTGYHLPNLNAKCHHASPSMVKVATDELDRCFCCFCKSQTSTEDFAAIFVAGRSYRRYRDTMAELMKQVSQPS